MEILFDHPKKKDWQVARIAETNHEGVIHKYRRASCTGTVHLYTNQTLLWQRPCFVFRTVIVFNKVLQYSTSDWFEFRDSTENINYSMRIKHFNELVELCRTPNSGFSSLENLAFVGMFSFNNVSGINIEPYIEKSK